MAATEHIGVKVQQCHRYGAFAFVYMIFSATLTGERDVGIMAIFRTFRGDRQYTTTGVPITSLCVVVWVYNLHAIYSSCTLLIR